MAAVSATAKAHRRKQATEYSRRWCDKNREKVRAANRGKWATRNKDTHHNSYLLRTYGITLKQYNAILKIQDGVCAICGRPPQTKRLHVDHDHHDGRVRGLLCYFCNRRVVGRLTLENARKVVAYLEREFDGRKIET